MKALVVITGPTGVGKTKTAIEIAKWLHTEIVNADSRQIYKGIPIGTAAPTEEELNAVRHHLTGILPLTEYYSASLFEETALTVISNLHETHDDVVMSGGSMMYIDAVCNGIDDIPTIDDETRQLLKHRYEQEGLEPLLRELQEKDPEYYDIVDRNNHKRVVHAMEIITMTGKTYTSFRTNTRKQRPFQIIKIGLTREREELYSRINQRVLEMIRQGFEEEARRVYPMRHCNSLNTVGYKEMFDYIDGKWSLQECIERIQGNTRRYCRKQLTWYKRDPEITWFHPDDVSSIQDYIIGKKQLIINN